MPKKHTQVLHCMMLLDRGTGRAGLCLKTSSTECDIVHRGSVIWGRVSTGLTSYRVSVRWVSPTCREVGRAADGCDLWMERSAEVWPCHWWHPKFGTSGFILRTTGRFGMLLRILKLWIICSLKGPLLFP